MKYMDQVVCEALRRWPAIPQLDRLCVKDYELELDGLFKLKLEKGDYLQFNVYGIHHDSKYFPEPEKFDPDRFSDENKVNIVSGSYIPFGIGPRICIGSRLAIMEMKVFLYYLLLKFSFKPNVNTQVPLKLKKSAFSLMPETSGIHMDLVARHK